MSEYQDNNTNIIDNESEEHPFITNVKNLIQEGNARRLLVKNQDGRTMLDTSLTVTAIVVFLVFIFPPGWLIGLIAVIVAVMARLRVEIVHVLTSDDRVVEVTLTEER